MPFSKKLFDNFSEVPFHSNSMYDLFSDRKPKYDDDVIECLQFGICFSQSIPRREIPSMN